ncbi:MAG: hydantoinase B/oxoprolinase family protein [Sphaerobacter thermophilus]|jgi:N-methylhydantoinase B|uniref:5-oxoprolinase (ATP-hydrolyzing) n=1 Tax=Sphaerobacter thermophilus (strain ATCC 49802 / DSM 20745 / KCCM 41009 / NCIMB 13125 / S 6022) TaxID=479434 RepID=D1C5D2_SPHTD|nr:hydantoinase B/oxoprolinase family protein [Sphaerobacter thermophilus]ACZ37448.1 5-oxoprolinase (ATP-hydrolyzing) [Sphaerobacter thermophilus DSM 20745]PZN64562.1 MAG: hydantoinase B/oxoprolinase family protein [Sphaerobacter thermophilus]
MVLHEKPLPDFVREHNIDQVTLDIIENALKNIRYEMDRVLVTTAVSPIIREQADEFPLIADRKGRMIVGQFGSPVDTVLAHSPYRVEDLKDGDVIATNDPYMMDGSTSHLPDILLVRPIFYDGDHIGYALQWGNLMDVGGSTAGSIPIDARSIYEEGVRMPPVKLYDGGKLNEDVLRFFCHNSRTPRETRADIMAIAAGTAAGAQRVKDICDRFGKDTYLEACDALLDRTRRSVIELIRKYIPEGQRFEFEDYTDDDGLGNGPIKLKLAMWREGDTLNLDWTGTDAQVPGPVNFLLNKRMFQMFAGVFLISAFDPTILFNDGYEDIINVTIPEGSVLQPKDPAPLSNRLVVMARLFDVLGAVYAKAIGFQVSGSYGTSPNFVYSGVKPTGEPFQTMEILYGGIPAIMGKDGLDGHSWWPEFLAVPAEYMETYYPLIVEEYRARIDSGGAGLYRGGCGIKKVYRFLADGRITYQDDRYHTYPYGVGGGKPGASSKKTLIRANGETVELPSKVRDVPVYAGDRLIFETAGAGGVGDPLERDPELVAKDVRWNLVSREAARRDYGVVLKDDGSVDAAATEAERAKIRATRGPLPEFDHGDLPPLEELSRIVAATRRTFNEWLSQELGKARVNGVR